MNQKQTRAKTKQRRANQKRSKTRTNLRNHHENRINQTIAHIGKAFDAATPADQKAIAARLQEVADVVIRNPAQAELSMELARRIALVPAAKNPKAKNVGASELPAVHASLNGLINSLWSVTPDACAHLTPQDAMAAVCIDHPASIMCGDCEQAHQDEGHPPEWVFQCCECGAVDMRGISPLWTEPMIGLAVRFGNSVQPFIAPVMPSGLAVCNPCRLAVGKKRARTGGGSGA